MLDHLAVVARQVVLGDQQDLDGVDDGLGQLDIRGLPVASTQEGEVLALVVGDVLMGVPKLRGIAVAIDVLGDDIRQLKSQRIGYRFLCHAVTVTGRIRNGKSPRGPSRGDT